MPRNASGTYTLPSGNPVVSGTLIDSSWANNTLNDMANEMTDSLSRSGEGGMLAPFRITDGLQATPSLAFTNEPSTGFYRAGTNEMWAVVGGTQITQFTATGMLGRFAAGAVTTPSVSAYGDTNTGIYFPGADQVAIATGGVQRLSIDSAGAVAIPGSFSVTGNVTIDTNTLFVDAANNRVGVGTVTPAVKLDVAGGISIGSADNLTWGGAYGATTPAISGAAGFLAFYPNGSTSGELMRLNATGLGIGTSSPGAKLSVDGSAIFNDSGADVDFRIEGDTDANLVFVDASADAVGFGTNAPSGKISVVEKAGGAPAIRIQGDSSTNVGRLSFTDNGVTRTNALLTADNSGNLAFAVNGTTTQMYLNSSGQLGIGTTSPSDRLHVKGVLRIEDSTDTTTRDYQLKVDTTGGLAFIDTVGPTTKMFLDFAGNLGVGTTTAPGANGGGIAIYKSDYPRLTFRNSTSGDGTGDGLQMALVGSDFTYDLVESGYQRWTTGGSERARITATGDVGIGTSNPLTRLHLSSASATYIQITDEGDGASRIGQNGTALTFGVDSSNGATERARITAAGSLLVGQTSANSTAAGIGLHNASGNWWVYAVGSSTTSDKAFSAYSTGAGAYRFFVDYAGNINATNTTITGISDVRLKENIRDLDAGLDSVMALKPRKFDWKAGKGKDKKDDRGFIAQEFEQVFPDLVTEWADDHPEGEEPYKAVCADLIPVLVKAIQELSAKVAALEAK